MSGNVNSDKPSVLFNKRFDIDIRTDEFGFGIVYSKTVGFIKPKCVTFTVLFIVAEICW